MKTISFDVTDEVAEEIRRKSVYLDVFGRVRWNTGPGLYEVVEGATGWAASDA